MRRLASLLPVLAALFSFAAPSAANTVTHHPRIGGPPVRNFGWSSSNWSGYAISGAGFSTVTGSWVVQSVARSHKATYSSQWIGIDGFNNSSLIQTGTESDFYSGTAHYAAWWEILPAAETVIPSISVSPGDSMSASVTRGSDTSWTITISDNTKRQSFSTVQTYTGPQTSAEWIEEAPSVGGRIAPLANYGQTTFDPGSVNGANPGLTFAESGIMVQKAAQVSTPSVPDGDNDGFNMEYGSKQPSAPAS
jgi:Peptidase A4 family